MTPEIQELCKRVDAARSEAEFAEVEPLIAAAIPRRAGGELLDLSLRYATVAEKLGKWEEAARRWRAASTRFPRNFFLVERLALALVRAQDWDKLCRLQRRFLGILAETDDRFPNGIAQALHAAAVALCELHADPREPAEEEAARGLVTLQLLLESRRAPRDVTLSLTRAAFVIGRESAERYARFRAGLDRLVGPWRGDVPVARTIAYLAVIEAEPRRNFAAVLEREIPRLSVYDLEMIFRPAANQALLPEVAPTLARTLAGQVMTDILHALRGERRPAEEVEAGYERALATRADTRGRLYEVRYAEWRLANLRAAPMPAPAVTLPRKALAVCVSGQLRGFEAAFPSWRRTVLKDVEHDIFVSAWRRVGRRRMEPAGFAERVLPPALAAVASTALAEIGYAALMRRQPALSKLLADDGEAVEDARVTALYQPAAWQLHADDAADFAGWNNQDRMHFQLAASHALMVASGTQYERVLFIRPDLEVLRGTAAECEAALEARGLLLDTGLEIFHGTSLMAGDRAAYATPEAARVHASLHQEKRRALPGVLGLEGALHPNRSLAFTLLAHGLVPGRMPLRFGRMLDPAALPLDLLGQALAADAEGRGDALDRQLQDALAADLGQGQAA